MCVFKALHENHHDNTPLSKEEFYNFHEVQNYKWREVRKNGDRDDGVFILIGTFIGN